jgi:RNase P subunit RPR2
MAAVLTQFDAVMTTRNCVRQNGVVKTTVRQASHMSVIVLNTEIVLECLHCGHAARMSEDGLRKYGEAPGASLDPLSKRLICRECRNVTVRAYRRIDNQAPLPRNRARGGVSPRRA